MTNNVLQETNFKFEGQTAFYKGKVRDVYTISGQLVMVVSDRISAFDHVLPKGIPFKGQVLNQIAQKFLDATQDIVPNWLVAAPDPNVSVGKNCDPFKIEMVIRGYLAGHAWREYKNGQRKICGVAMPDGLKEGTVFLNPSLRLQPKLKKAMMKIFHVKKSFVRGLSLKRIIFNWKPTHGLCFKEEQI